MKFIVQFESDQEKMNIFKDVISNYGLSAISNYGFEISIRSYADAKDDYSKKNPSIEPPYSFEDIVVHCIDEMGESIEFNDVECGGEYNVVLDKEAVLRGLDNVPSYLLKEIADETYDSDTCDSIMQYILFNEIVFC